MNSHIFFCGAVGADVAPYYTLMINSSLPFLTASGRVVDVLSIVTIYQNYFALYRIEEIAHRRIYSMSCSHTHGRWSQMTRVDSIINIKSHY